MDSSRLFEFLKSLNVEKNWKQNTHVDWLSGKPINISYKSPTEIKRMSIHSHCSSFVASVCYQLNVPMLILPNFTEGLANKQGEWLSKKGRDFGWIPISVPITAQQCANSNYLVVMCCVNTSIDTMGHIAIVCPYKRTASGVEKYGVRICQSGRVNTTSANALDLYSKSGYKKYKYYAFEL